MTTRVAVVFERATARQSVRQALDNVEEAEVVVSTPAVRGISTRTLDAIDVLVVGESVSDYATALEHVRDRPDLVLVVFAENPGVPVSPRIRVLARPNAPAELARAVVSGLFPDAAAPTPTPRPEPSPRAEPEPRPVVARVEAETTDAAPATTPARAASSSASTPSPQHPNRRDLLVIGASTGGPDALETVIGALPAWLSVPVLVCQHMPADFTALLAKKLDAASPFPVRELTAPAVAAPSTVWVAPGGRHMVVANAAGGLEVSTAPPENSCRPSVDVLFRSAAQHFAGRVVAVMLTGMGQDGLAGVRTLAERGAHVIAQNEATSTVWGMPGAVANAGLADQILPLADIAPAIVEEFLSSDLVSGTRSTRADRRGARPVPTAAER